MKSFLAIDAASICTHVKVQLYGILTKGKHSIPHILRIHKSLDGLLGTQERTSASSSILPLQTVSTPCDVPNVSNKQGMPCILFRKGCYLKVTGVPFCMHQILQIH
ncbi:Hypothetical predicted protein [Olea europaea subsp. europaea]|uniref:Uncharacterized protein n=1 Tax=Olea europaea subsp. europaea TaxID=158383 RepID=A0A8S0P647_OLEEU|nr:Hypothetical predicted protein [Olea europaea subsp. europaea]